MTQSILAVPQWVLGPAAAAAFALAFAVVKLSPRARRGRGLVVSAKPLLTGNEIEFYGRLRRALPAHHVLPQVSMGALLSARVGRGRFDRKVVDFVVCDRSLTVVVLVELDDRTHSASRDRARDALTREAGYRTLRYGSRSKPTEARIAADVRAIERGRR